MVDETEYRNLSNAVKSRATRFEAPPDLRLAISAAVAQSAQSAARGKSPTPAFRWPGLSWLKIGAAMACGFVVSMLVTQLYFSRNDTVLVKEEVISAHVQSLMVAHLQDIASSDQHTVKPWFAGKLDFSPPVRDFSSEGFALAGGRLDYIDKHIAAALVYRRHGHVINVFVWPNRAAGESKELSTSQEGFNLIAWSGGGMQFWIISDVNREDLNQFSKLLRSGGV